MAELRSDETMQEALAHYGVKGMRWGVRKKDEPTRSERKQEKRDIKVANLTAQAAKADIRVAELDKQLAATPKKLSTFGVRNDLQNQRNATANYSKNRTETAEAIREGRLTPNQKRLIVGGAITAGVVLAAYGTTKIESGEFNSLKLRGQALVQRRSSPFHKNPDYAGPKTADQLLGVMKGINPGYNRPGGQMNCRRSTFTYELRRRGYDVVATTSSVGYGQSESGLLNALSPGKRNVNSGLSLSSNVARGLGIRNKAAGDKRKSIGDRFEVSDAKDRKSFIDAFKSQPDGARGESVFNFGAFGHSLAYEKVGGKVYIFDTQKNKRYDTSKPEEYDSFLYKWGYDRVKDVQITRLDNLDLDEKFVSRWSTNKSKSIQEGEKQRAEQSRRDRERKTQERKRQAEARSRLPSERPEDMHITTWNRLRREAGLT